MDEEAVDGFLGFGFSIRYTLFSWDAREGDSSRSKRKRHPLTLSWNPPPSPFSCAVKFDNLMLSLDV